MKRTRKYRHRYVWRDEDTGAFIAKPIGWKPGMKIPAGYARIRLRIPVRCG